MDISRNILNWRGHKGIGAVPHGKGFETVTQSPAVSNPSFLEVQRFRQLWLLALFAGIEAIFVWALVQQIVLGEPWGNRPASNEVLLMIFVLAGVFLPVLILSANLRVEVRPEGLVYRFFPLQLRERTIAWDQVVGHQVFAYGFRDFGGWGIRYGSIGLAFTVRGNKGVLLDLGKRKILFGSQEAQRLDDAIGLMVRK
jgi:hypothetical protein